MVIQPVWVSASWLPYSSSLVASLLSVRPWKAGARQAAWGLRLLWRWGPGLALERYCHAPSPSQLQAGPPNPQPTRALPNLTLLPPVALVVPRCLASLGIWEEDLRFCSWGSEEVHTSLGSQRVRAASPDYGCQRIPAGWNPSFLPSQIQATNLHSVPTEHPSTLLSFSSSALASPILHPSEFKQPHAEQLTHCRSSLHTLPDYSSEARALIMAHTTAVSQGL